MQYGNFKTNNKFFNKPPLDKSTKIMYEIGTTNLVLKSILLILQ